jgi:hypothetical protein
MWSVAAELPDPGGGTDAVPSRTTRGSSSGRVEIAPKVAPAEGPPRRGRTTPPRGHEPTVAGPRRHSKWSGTTSVAVPRGPAGVQVTRASAPKGPGARLGRRSRWRLGSAEGYVQVGSDLGHDLLGAADPGLQPHSQLARRWPLCVRAAGLTVTLCPATCSLTEMVTGHLRSVRYGRTYPLGKPVTKLPAGVPVIRSVAVALVTPRHAPVPTAALAGVPRPGHGGPEGRCEAEGRESATENREQQNTTHFC